MRADSYRMTRQLVAAGFAWDEYPGLRAGRLYAGRGDLGRHPVGPTDVVADPDAGTTLCGLEVLAFPHAFAPTVRTDTATLCGECGPAAIGST